MTEDPAVKLAVQFVQHYYAQFSNKNTRPTLINLYRDQSQLSFEKNYCKGREQIYEFLSEGCQFQTLNVQMEKIDAQDNGNTILILLGGQVKMDNDAYSIAFQHVFLVNKVDINNAFIINEIFKLNVQSL